MMPSTVTPPRVFGPQVPPRVGDGVVLVREQREAQPVLPIEGELFVRVVG
jgi:hypothetical protein